MLIVHCKCMALERQKTKARHPASIDGCPVWCSCECLRCVQDGVPRASLHTMARLMDDAVEGLARGKRCKMRVLLRNVRKSGRAKLLDLKEFHALGSIPAEPQAALDRCGGHVKICNRQECSALALHFSSGSSFLVCRCTGKLCVGQLHVDGTHPGMQCRKTSCTMPTCMCIRPISCNVLLHPSAKCQGIETMSRKHGGCWLASHELHGGGIVQVPEVPRADQGPDGHGHIPCRSLCHRLCH